jgi:hypothetical protein
MILVETFFLTVFAVTPLSLGLAWWRWFRGQPATSRSWRETALLVGLVTASSNALLFAGWIAYRLTAGPTESVWAAKRFATDLAGYLLIASLIGVLVGKGRGRILGALGALTGFLLWTPIGIL